MNDFTFDIQRFDNINNTVDGASVVGTTGDDTIYSTGSDVTINALTGNDSVNLNNYLASAVIQYAAGDGNDTITGYTSEDGSFNYRLQITGSAYSSAISGSNVILGVGTDSITIEDAMLTTTEVKGIDIVGSYRDSNGDISNSDDSVNVYGTSDADSIVNKGQDVTIHALGGNDTIHNEAGSNVYIDAGTGSNEIYNGGGSTGVTILGGEGADTINNSNGANASINGGAGADSILTQNSNDVSISGGAGNDTITLDDGVRRVIQYNDGDGNDSIIGFTTSDTLIIGSGAGAYSTTTSGDDIIVTSYGGYITLTGAATLSALNISGELSGDSSTDQTITGATWIGTDADEEHGTTYYDIATEKTTIYSALYGMGGNDKLTNYPAFANVTIDGGADDDQIYNRGAYGSLIGGEGNDYIENKGVDNAKVNNSTIDAGAGADVVDNLGDNVSISVGDGDDSVYSQGDYATITGGAGDDTLYSYGNYSSIDGGEDDDNLIADGSNVTVHGGEGNDTLQFSGSSDSIASNGIVEDTIGNNYFHSEYITTSTITGGDGNDTLYSAHIEDVTINLGAGNNSVNSQYDKNITINAAGGDDTINIYDGSNINLNVGDGANIINISNINDSDASVYTINAGTGADSVKIDVNNALINLGDGDNTITTGGYEAGNNVTINTGSGDDYISNSYNSVYGSGRQENVLINVGAGNDTVMNNGNKTTINGGDGADEIQSYDGTDYIINGDAGADTIFGANGTLNGGEGNDTIRAGENVLIQYASGDGDDFIEEFNSSTTLSISGGTYSTTSSGDNVVVTVGDGNVTLSGAASVDNLNIVGTYSGDSGSTDTNWATVTSSAGSTVISADDTVANGTDSADTITTASIDGDTTARAINGNGGNDSILNFVSKVTISGGADKDSVVSSADNVVIQTGGGNDYIQGATKGNVNITIDAGDGDDEIDTYGTNASINGGAGNDSIKISADSEKVTIIAGEGSDTVVNTATDSFIDGGAGADSIHNDSGNVTIDAGADDDVITSYGDKVSISGGAGADKIIVTNSYDGVGTISGGIGDDTVSIGSGNFLLEYTSGDGADVINGFKANDTLIIGDGTGTYSTTSSGDNVIVNVGEGSITLTGAESLSALNINGTYGSGDTDTWATIISSAGTTAISASSTVANGTDSDDTITTATIESDTTARAINGNGGNDSIVNVLSNVTINGGSGNDTITNSGSNNIYIYNKNEGNDVINGFTANDTLYVGGGIYSTAASGDDVVLTVGDGNITLQGAASLDTLNITGEYNILAETFVTALEQKTEAGYPIIAGLFFHPTEYHGFETLSSSYYAESETLTINSADGLQLTGYHYTPENPNDKWVILVHGYGHNHRHMNGFAMQYLQNNYQVLMVDQRAAGYSEYECSEGEWLTMGAAEGEDVALWTHKIAEINSNAKITLHGVSMGAATAMLAAANSNLTNVTSLVEDCGYTQVIALVDIAKSYMPQLEEPEFVSLVSDTAGKLTGYKLSAAAPIDSIGNATMPSMFITGTADEVISMSMLESLYAASGAETKEIFTVEGATHGVSALTDSIGYANAVFRFNAEAAGEGWVTDNVTDSISLRGTKYDDTITSSGNNVTINTGVGDDTITNSGKVLLQYTSGDGNDVINGFTASDTLVIGAGTGTYSTVTSGDNVVVNVGDGNIVITNAASIEKLNINGNYDAVWATITSSEGTTKISASSTVVNGTDSDDTITTATIDSDKTARVINGNGGNDSIVNVLSNVTISGGTGNDTINNTDNNKTFIDAGDGNNYISNNLAYEVETVGTEETLHNYYSDTSIVAGSGNDTVSVTGGFNVSITTGEGDDSIYSKHSYKQTLDAGNGNDYVQISEGNLQYILGNGGDDTIIGETVTGKWAIGGYATVDGGAGADYVSVGYSNNASINGGTDNDTIITYGTNSEIFGGDGDDSITLFTNTDNTTLNSAGSTVTGGTGNDTITGDGSGVIYQYNTGDGNDVISGFSSSDTLLIDSTDCSTVTSGNNVVVTSGEANITLIDAATLSSIKIITPLSIGNTLNNTLITGTEGNDQISNSGSNVTINALGGNDTINNIDNDKTFIDAGDGDDYIENDLTYELLQDVLYNYYSDTTIVAGSGNDTVSITGGYKVSVSAGEGDDSLLSHHSYYQTIDGGLGNDIVLISEGHHEYITGGDGADSIIGTITGPEVDDWAMGGYATINGGAGADYVSVGYSNNASINGGVGNDTIIAYGPNSEIFGDDGDDVISLISNGETTLNSNGTTISGGAGNDTITGDGSGVVFKYGAGDGNDVIVGFTSNDSLALDSAYKTSVSGNDLIVTVSSSSETITLKNAANITPQMSVAIIASGNSTYAQYSLAQASEIADNNSTVTVIGNSTETSEINSTKGLTFKFAESGLGAYNVTGGNFVSADISTSAQFSISSNRVLSNSNSLLINSGSTSTLDGYAVTGTSNGYTFSLQNNPFTLNGASYKGEGTASFDMDNKVTLTSGAIVNDSDLTTASTGIVLNDGAFTLNGNNFSTTATHTVYLDEGGAHFAVATDTVTYNSMSFTGDGSASIVNNVPTLTAGIAVTGAENVMMNVAGRDTINNREFWLTQNLDSAVTVGTVTNGITAAHIVPAEDFPEDAGKTFSEEALIYGDDNYTVRLDYEGIRSIYGLSAGSTVRGISYLDGKVDTLGSILQLAVDGSGAYTFGDKTYTLGGSIDSVNVVALTSRFHNDGSSALRRIYYLNGTISGDFSSAVTINQASMPVQVTGDDNISIYATDSSHPTVDANSSTISSSGNASVISGVSNGAHIISAGGATKVTTDEEGAFVFRSDSDTQQGFTVTGDTSVDFILRNYTDADGNPTMQVEGVNNFENGQYSFNSDTAYHGINVGENIKASDEYEMVFSDIATLTISDSKVVEVSGIDQHINGLRSDVTVHATNSMTVNNIYANVEGDNNFDVLVTGGKTTDLANISAGASVSVASINAITDSNGTFQIGTQTYSVNDVNESVTFITDRNAEVQNVANFSGTLGSSANNITVNGANFTTSNTDASVTSAGTDITGVIGLVSGDSISGALNTALVSMPGAEGTDTSTLTINGAGYTLANDGDGVLIGNYYISGLSTAASLRVDTAGDYRVNSTVLSAKAGDIFIGTAEGSAYIYNPNNVPLNTGTMTDDEIAAQAGVSTEYVVTETNTMVANSAVEAGGSSLEGSMALAIDNSSTTTEQNADLSGYGGKKRVSLEGGAQNVKFNNEGGNVAIVDSDATGNKNITLGNGGDLAIIKDTSTPVNVTAGTGADSIVTSGENVNVNLTGGATKIIPNGGNVNVNGYDPSTGAGIQANDYSSIERAIENGNIGLVDGSVNVNGVNVTLNDSDAASTIVNLFNNIGKKTKVAYTHSGGGAINASAERENLLLVGNKDLNKGASSLTGGSGDDTALGGAGDYIDLGAGNNYVSLNGNSSGDRQGATVAMTATTGKTEVSGFNSGFGDDGDRISVDVSNTSVKFVNGRLTFNYASASLTLNIGGSSADLIEDDNFIGESADISDITPITYEQGDYQNIYGTNNDSLKGGIEITFAQG